MSALSLHQWLSRLEKQHPVAIDLGLERIQAVARQLALPSVAKTVVTVAGTNGKGSFVRTLEQYLLQAGQRVGAYTSPHLLHYNERIRINGVPATDAAICSAFEKIDQARGDISLTYFEVGTLAAFLLMAEASLDVAILEVGLGGRCDAVNIVDADIAVITSIALDHTDWLGDTREQIALEKAGIARAGRPVVCADPHPPGTLRDHLEKLSCPTLYLGRDFDACAVGSVLECRISKGEASFAGLPLPSLPLPSVAAAVQVAAMVCGELDAKVLATVLANVSLDGRFQKLGYKGRTLILDVAHNPAAALHLAQQLRMTCGVPLHAVAAIMADKDVDGFVAALVPVIDHWYLGNLESVDRALSASSLASVVYTNGAAATCLPGIPDALEAAVDDTAIGDIIVVCGSFFTVAATLAYLQGQNP